MNPPPKNRFTVFTKPWRELSLAELGALVHELGFDGVELPVRDGYQVEPESVSKGLAEASKVLADHGVFIGSVAGPVDAATIGACGENGVPLIRTCVSIDMSIGYAESERRTRARFESLVPALDNAGVTVGVQNHYGTMVGSAIGIMHLIESFAPNHVGAVLDPAHCAVDGEPAEMALDIVWSHLCLVNFKSASHRRTNRISALEAEWEVIWTTAPHSGYSWREMATLLRSRGYGGDICLPAEYSTSEGGGQLMGEAVIRNLQYDIAYIKHLFSSDVDSQVESFRTADRHSTLREAGRGVTR